MAFSSVPLNLRCAFCISLNPVPIGQFTELGMPFVLQELKAKFSSSALNASSSVWNDGLADWQKISQVPGLEAQLSPPAAATSPRPPPASVFSAASNDAPAAPPSSTSNISNSHIRLSAALTSIGPFFLQQARVATTCWHQYKKARRFARWRHHHPRLHHLPLRLRLPLNEAQYYFISFYLDMSFFIVKLFQFLQTLQQLPWAPQSNLPEILSPSWQMRPKPPPRLKK